MQDRLEKLIESYDVSGVLLDELRFPDADSCQCPACRAALGRRVGKPWAQGPAPDDDSEDRRVWLSYRADLIRDLTQTLVAAIRRADPEVAISAALRPEGALDSRGAVVYGQGYEDLTPLFDFVIATAYHRREDLSLS